MESSSPDNRLPGLEDLPSSDGSDGDILAIVGVEVHLLNLGHQRVARVRAGALIVEGLLNHCVETRKEVLDLCYDAVLEIKSLLAEMKQKREYANEAYLAANEQAGTMISLKEWREKAPPKFDWEGK